MGVFAGSREGAGREGGANQLEKMGGDETKS